MSGAREVTTVRHLDELSQIEGDWARLIRGSLFSVPSFDSIRAWAREFDGRFLVLVHRTGGCVTALACFYCVKATKAYKAGERMLFTLPVRDLRLYGSAMPGVAEGEVAKHFIDIVNREFRFDVLTLGDVPLASPLYAAVMAQQDRFVVTELSRKRSLRWLIRMPQSFDAYMMTLGAKSRQNLRREARLFEKQFQAVFQSVRHADQAETFLRDAETISRKTYQWNVGQRIVNDEPARHALVRRAQQGELQCYVLHADGAPVAFMRGRLAGGTYDFETAGFDPAFAKASPGAVLLLFAIRDLIEQAHCITFDFGQGGDLVGYKARFGNESHVCSSLQLGPRWSVYTRILFALQSFLFATLNLANHLLGEGKLRARVKKALRKYGDR